MSGLYLGTDLGGTTIVSGVVDENGKLLSRISLPTPHAPHLIADTITRSCRLALEQSKVPIQNVEALGVGVPGNIFPENTVSFACNLHMRNFPLADQLQQRLSLPVYLENDGNCAAVGEYMAGCGRGRHSLLCVTIGTGIGGGFISAGRLWRGINGCAMEIGHMVINHRGPVCACGRNGCFETLASTSALIRRCREYIHAVPDSYCANIARQQGQINGQTVFLAMDAGDTGAAQLFNDYTADLACGLTNLINILQPEVLCIGGGISAQGERLLAPVRRQIMEVAYARDCPPEIQILPAVLGNDAGLLGAAFLKRLKEINTL